LFQAAEMRKKAVEAEEQAAQMDLEQLCQSTLEDFRTRSQDKVAAVGLLNTDSVHEQGKCSPAPVVRAPASQSTLLFASRREHLVR
jgi:hypothetical protein